MRSGTDESGFVALAGIQRGSKQGVLRSLWTWLHNTRSRAALRELPPHLLRDVGMSRAEAEAESLKRFWMK